MTEESSKPNDPSRSNDSRMPGDGSRNVNNPAIQPPSGTPIGDPKRTGFGDMPEDPNQRTDASKGGDHGVKNEPSRTGGQRDQGMGGERKGSSMPVGSGVSEKRSQGERPNTNAPHAPQDQKGSAGHSGDVKQQGPSTQHTQQSMPEKHGQSPQQATPGKSDQRGQPAQPEAKKSSQAGSTHTTNQPNEHAPKSTMTGTAGASDENSSTTKKTDGSKSARSQSAGGNVE